MEFFILALLQLKHWYVDFVNQTPDEVANKGTYGNWAGLMHSIKHGLATIVVLSYFITVPWALILGLIDFVVHYHVDWAKMNYGNRDITTKQFWNHLGLDQMAHQITYIAIVAHIAFS
jgi:hypothetical protein